MGLPLDDSYIYLTYAKQFGRGQPFTYFPGGGYSAGSTSVLWPMVLAPFWALGARGHALVWVSFVVSTALYVASVLGVARLIVPIAGRRAAVLGAIVVLAIAPFAWTALSGMEVAFASALLVFVISQLRDAPRTGPPPWRLALGLAAASLSRPEATLLVIAIIAVTVIRRRHDLRAAAWWLAPLAAPIAWLTANKLLAGNWFPNTGVAKSHFYLPGFDWTYWLSAVVTLTGRMLRGLFWDPASPLVWPKLFAIAWIAGAVRVALWARRERQWLVGAVILGAPFVLALAVIASSGLWSFQNYRYIAPAFPLLAITVGCAFAPIRRGAIVHAVLSIAAVTGFAIAALPNLIANALLYAQGAMDTNTQVVAIGEYIHRKLPDANVMFHDAGAIAYYGDGRVYDMLGLVTNHQAGIANHGPGARFEFLDNLPVDQRFTHFAYYPSWMGTSEFFAADLLHTPLRPGFAASRLVGDSDMQVLAASWDHTGTGRRPLTPHPGWSIVDRINIADLASEADHHWSGALGRRAIGDPTAKWSMVGRTVGPAGLILDGGRTIRGGREQFTITADPAKPIRLLLRTGGARSYPYHETINAPVTVRLVDAAGRELTHASVPPPDGSFVEVAFDLPAGAPTIVRTQADAPYRAFHWFVLQPD
jgi:hypothetical protein